MSRKHVYKIFQIAEWADFQSKGIYKGSPVDRLDGFIHLSCAHQLQGTLDKHYIERKEVVIGEVFSQAFGNDLRFEVSRGGEDFPHLYADLHLNAVTRHWVLSPDDKGRYEVADLPLTY